MIQRTLIAILLWLAAGAAAAEPAPSPDDCVPRGIPVTEGFVASPDGTRLYYRKLGRGRPTAIYLHGGPGGTIYNGGCEIAALARHHPLVLYDQRGGGRSDLVAEAGRLTWRHHVEDLDAVRRHFGLRRMSLIGLSWGSALATLYARAHPRHVGRLLLLSPMPIANVPFDREREAAIARAAGPELMRRRGELQKQMRAATSDAQVLDLCRRLLEEAPLPYALDPARRRTLTGCHYPAAVVRNRAAVARHTLQSLGDWDFRPAVAAIRVPVLVVEGDRSVVPPDLPALWARTAPKGRLLRVPDAGHEVGIDQPEALVQAARLFLSGRWPPGALRD
ncbi:MAG TPA: alpha/beta hydrolase [Allosphingosinicella sp.]|nr:alpha/beta hydrolase [Allosphingosinicella sp.]